MRTVNPDDLDQLAKLLDGRGGAKEKLDEAFTRAAQLGVSASVASLKPMRPWVGETAPDLRRRAAIGRLENGDSEAGVKWAGFNSKEIAKAALLISAPDVLLLANAMASSDDSKANAFRRKSNESIDDWVDRLRAHAIASIPGLGPHEAEIAQILGAYGDGKGILTHGGVAVFHGVNITKILTQNSITQGWLSRKKLQLAAMMQDLPYRYGWVPARVSELGRNLQNSSPFALRSLSYPGGWLPSHLGGLASGSRIYQDANRIPMVGSAIGVRIGRGVDWLRRSNIMASPILSNITGDKAIEFLVGSDRLAAMYGGLTHSGAIPSRAANSSLWKVGKNVYNDSRIYSGRLGSFADGLKIAGRAGGFLRGFGIVGNAYSMVYGGVNVWKQGDPKSHFKNRSDGAKYVADVDEVLFNASMISATVAPSQYTVGAVAVTGAVWVGAKVVEHWDDVSNGAKSVSNWIGENAPNAKAEVAHELKSLSKKVNPMDMFRGK